jgi:hypothetical protein
MMTNPISRRALGAGLTAMAAGLATSLTLRRLHGGPCCYAAFVRAM